MAFVSKVSVPVVPAHPLHVAMFVTELCISAMGKGTGISVLEAAVYSIRWAYQIAGLMSPSDHPLVESSQGCQT